MEVHVIIQASEYHPDHAQSCKHSVDMCIHLGLNSSQNVPYRKEIDGEEESYQIEKQ